MKTPFRQMAWLIAVTGVAGSLVGLTGCDGDLRVAVNECEQDCVVIQTIQPIVGLPGTTLTLTGVGFDENFQMQVDDRTYFGQVDSDEKIRFVIPEGPPSRMRFVIQQEQESLELGYSYRISAEHPTIVATPDTQCRDVTYYDGEGVLQQGTRDCVKTTGFVDPDWVLEGTTISGVAGAIPTCQQDGAVNCFATGSLVATNPGSIGTSVLAGEQLAGITGNVALPAPETVQQNVRYGPEATPIVGTVPIGSVSDCTAAGQSACVATASYPAQDLREASASIPDLTSDNLTSMLQGADTFEFWDETGTRHVASGDVDFVAANLQQGLVAAGLTGTVPMVSAVCAAADSQDCFARNGYYVGPKCTANGEKNCLLSESGIFAAADLSNLAPENIRRGITIAGIRGDFPSAGRLLPAFTSGDPEDTTLASGSETDLTDYTTQYLTTDTFQYWDRFGQRRSFDGTDQLVSTNLRRDVVLENFGITGIVVERLPPNGLTADYVPGGGGDEFQISWTSQGADHYLVVLRAGDTVSFRPQNGVEYVLGPQDGHTVIHAGPGLSVDHVVANVGERHQLAVWSYSSDFIYSDMPAVTDIVAATPVDCSSLAGGDWVHVQANAALGVPDFCMMKYEAKGSTAAPNSVAAGAPLSSMQHAVAQTACESLGAGYTLPSLKQWTTVATHAVTMNRNWTGGIVGSGTLYVGHSDNSPAMACAASNDDALGYVEGNCTVAASGGAVSNRRTMILPGGQTIWDLGGNVAEFILDVDATGEAIFIPSDFDGVEYSTAIEALYGQEQQAFVPTSATLALWNPNWNHATKEIGRIGGRSDRSVTVPIPAVRGGPSMFSVQVFFIIYGCPLIR